MSLRWVLVDLLRGLGVEAHSVYVGCQMSPTVPRYKGYRLFFFSREESRMHVHVWCSDGEAKVWIEPAVSVAVRHRLSSSQIGELQKLIEENRDDIAAAWKVHFSN